MSGLDQARALLRQRQGRGARDDAPEAPAGDLAAARLGTAFFARKLNELPDAALYVPSQLEGWTRAHVICDVAYQARAISRQIEAAAAGLIVPPLHEHAEAAEAEITLGATLPPRALRHLFDHAAIHLNVVWRDLDGGGWRAAGPGEDGLARLLSQTPVERARRLWQRALHLGNGVRLRDLPIQFQPQVA
ncbi:maleylpyruvate isomerase N-terminal domain-containing protein [Shinella sp. NM-101]|uniref:maleylpyruvate isomerase N-terminal domain-containing protein n=1 Tax=Shinella sp. NM-101 TaxID=2744455 RepID=UPI001F272851|nr:maleylpyruvate isomerase N-terminal domain-containing protein [Shinella sp. NM-101]